MGHLATTRIPIFHSTTTVVVREDTLRVPTGKNPETISLTLCCRPFGSSTYPTTTTVIITTSSLLLLLLTPDGKEGGEGKDGACQSQKWIHDD